MSEYTRAWPKARVDRVREMSMVLRMSQRAIAAEFGLSESRICTICKRHGIPAIATDIKWSGDNIERVRRLAEGGVRQYAIAYEFGVSPSLISQMCRRKGIKPASGPLVFTDPLLAEAHAWRMEGYGHKWIAARLGVSSRSLAVRLCVWRRRTGAPLGPRTRCASVSMEAVHAQSR